jgi:hypothetical protein
MQEAISTEELRQAILRFVAWLERYGETSYDHQSFFASKAGRRVKALYYQKPLLGRIAVSPMIFCEAFLPSTRSLFGKRQRFPIADAHYAMGFAALSETLGRALPPSRGPFSRSSQGDAQSWLRTLCLGISIRLGNASSVWRYSYSQLA